MQHIDILKTCDYECARIISKNPELFVIIFSMTSYSVVCLNFGIKPVVECQIANITESKALFESYINNNIQKCAVATYFITL